MGKKIEIPKRCELCDYMKGIPGPADSVTLYACSHKDSFDKEQVALFVMPSQEPPTDCGLRVRLKELEAKRVRRKAFFHKILHPFT